MGKYPRKKLLIDSKVQGALVARVFAYWLLFVAGIFLLLVGFPLVVSLFVRSNGAPTATQIVLQTCRAFWPAIFASVLMLPLLILDILRVSNRFAGPLFRLRNALRDLADGKAVTNIKFRKGDFWFDLAEDFNRAAARVNERGTSQSHVSPSSALSETVAEDHYASV